MKRGHLSDYFSGVVVKRLSAVETAPSVSNQHEFNGSGDLKTLMGEADRKNILVRFIWIAEEQAATEAFDGFLSWYDARRNHPTRSEYRLYYQTNPVTELMAEGDTLFLALRKDGTGLVVVTPSDGTMFNQLMWLFGITPTGHEEFEFSPVRENQDAELDFAARNILEALGIEPEEQEVDLLDGLIQPFGKAMPKASELSKLARESIGFDAVCDDPDWQLLQWMERETQLFRRIERLIVADRIASGFGALGREDVDGFISFSLSVQNRRKSRAGLALESHVEALLLHNSVGFTRGAKTENGNRPDFLFPSVTAYHDPDFPTERLLMLGAKSTLKERWRQVLSEASRIENKHLLTLEPGISQSQTDEMRAKSLQLVVPKSLHTSYRETQQEWLMDIAGFLQLAKSLQ